MCPRQQRSAGRSPKARCAKGQDSGCRRLVLKTGKMACAIDAENAGAAMRDFDHIQRARVLREPPIGRGRHLQDLQKDRPVHAVMADEGNGLVAVMGENKPDGVGRACKKILQRVAAREADEMRRGFP